MFKHLVLSGGAHLGITELGALLYLEEKKLFNNSDIEVYDGTSIGAVFSVLFSLGSTARDLVDYFVNRPWEQVIQESFPLLSIDSISSILDSGGILGYNFIMNILKPFLLVHFEKARQGNIDCITMNDLYEYTHKKVYLYTVEMNTDNNINLVSLSHETHPELSLLKAIQMSCALPLIFKPVIHNDCYYIDGGILSNYPLQQAIERNKDNKEEILAIHLRGKEYTLKKSKHFLLDFHLSLLNRIINHLRVHYEVTKKEIPYEMVIMTDQFNTNSMISCLRSREARERLSQQGRESAIIFCQYTDLSR